MILHYFIKTVLYNICTPFIYFWQPLICQLSQSAVLVPLFNLTPNSAAMSRLEGCDQYTWAQIFDPPSELWRIRLRQIVKLRVGQELTPLLSRVESTPALGFDAFKPLIKSLLIWLGENKVVKTSFQNSLLAYSLPPCNYDGLCLRHICESHN